MYPNVHYSSRERRTLALAPALLCLLATTALANPTGGVVNGGSASIGSSGTTLTVTQTSNRAIIDWQGFDINSGETTQFQQPNSSAIALNRIHSGTPSQINGNLTANGNLILVNPNGVVFGSGAQVDVNSLVATTSNISNSNFLAGNMVFDTPGNPNATISNAGTITAAQAGLVGLVAPNVINSGTITANLGKVQLASGDTFTLDLYGDGLMNVAISDAVTSQLVTHSGVISAPGGQVSITAAAGRQIVNSLITVSGEIDTPAVANQNGVITIYAQGSHATAAYAGLAAAQGTPVGNSTVLVSGYLNATNDHGQGGRITVTADHVGIASTAVIDASGATGGGVVAIGGDLHGGATVPPSAQSDVEAATLAAVANELGPTPTPTALYTVVQSGAIIKADAIQSGHGGLVTVWADQQTEFGGHIEANGGLQGGDGGLIETSGHGVLIITEDGDVEALSDEGDDTPIDPLTRMPRSRNANRSTRSSRTVRGRSGEWLLDPADITIDGGATTANINVSGANPITFAATDNATGSHVLASTVNSDLQLGTSVIINTAAFAGGGSGDITVASAIDGTGGVAGGGLTLTAYRNIVINASITLNNGALILDADNANHGSGSIYVGANITTNGGAITMGGGTLGSLAAGVGYATGNAASTVIVDLYGAGTFTGYGIGIKNGVTVNASGGNIIMNGIGYNTAANSNYGIYINGGTATTSGGGTITLNGTGGGASANSSSNYGLELNGKISAVDGLVTVNAKAGGAGSGSANMGIYDYGSINTPGSGNLSVNGTGGASSGGNNAGVYILASNSIMASGSGSITVSGTGGSGAGGSNIGVNTFGFGGKDIATSGSGSITVDGVSGTGGAGDYGVSDSFVANAIKTTGSGNITVNTDTILLSGANDISSVRVLTIAPYSNIGMSVGANVGGTLNLSDTYLGYLTGAWYVFGSATTASGGANNSTLTINTAHDFTTKGVAFVSGGDVDLNGVLTASGAGTPVVLSALGDFVNTAGATPFSLNAARRWTIYSTNPSLDTLNGLTSDFRRFSCTYAGGCATGVNVPAAGNGFFYSITPTITITPSVQNVTYGNAATLVGYGYAAPTAGQYLSVADFAADTVGGALTGTSTYVAGNNVGTYNLNYASGSLTSAMGYGFIYANNAAGINVVARNITITAANQTQTYGAGNTLTQGTSVTAGSLAAGDTFTGETLATNATSSGSGNWNATNGTPWTITASAATGTGGFGAGNYNITYATGTLTINNKTLTVTSSGGDKVYDGTTTATPTLGDNRVAGDVFTASGASAYDSGDAGARTINVSGIGIVGIDAANYTLAATTASNAATITPRALMVTTASQSNTVGATAPTFTGSTNLLASDAALINWAYGPLGSPSTPGSYSILATATDPSNRLANYLRTNHYGTYTILSGAVAAPSVVTPATLGAGTITQALLFDMPDTVRKNSQKPFMATLGPTPVVTFDALYSIAPMPGDVPFTPLAFNDRDRERSHFASLDFPSFLIASTQTSTMSGSVNDFRA